MGYRPNTVIVYFRHIHRRRLHRAGGTVSRKTANKKLTKL